MQWKTRFLASFSVPSTCVYSTTDRSDSVAAAAAWYLGAVRQSPESSRPPLLCMQMIQLHWPRRNVWPGPSYRLSFSNSPLHDRLLAANGLPPRIRLFHDRSLSVLAFSFVKFRFFFLAWVFERRLNICTGCAKNVAPYKITCWYLINGLSEFCNRLFAWVLNVYYRNSVFRWLFGLLFLCRFRSFVRILLLLIIIIF